MSIIGEIELFAIMYVCLIHSIREYYVYKALILQA